MTRLFSAIVIPGLFGLITTPAIASPPPTQLPAPAGLHACAAGDPTLAAVTDIAAKLGGEFLGCFLSDKTFDPSGAAKAAAMPLESAFAIALKGATYTTVDLDRLLLGVREQWKNFDPLDGKLKDSYISKLIETIG